MKYIPRCLPNFAALGSCCLLAKFSEGPWVENRTFDRFHAPDSGKVQSRMVHVSGPCAAKPGLITVLCCPLCLRRKLWRALSCHLQKQLRCWRRRRYRLQITWKIKCSHARGRRPAEEAAVDVQWLQSAKSKPHHHYHHHRLLASEPAWPEGVDHYRLQTASEMAKQALC